MSKINFDVTFCIIVGKLKLLLNLRTYTYFALFPPFSVFPVIVCNTYAEAGNVLLYNFDVPYLQ